MIPLLQYGTPPVMYDTVVRGSTKIVSSLWRIDYYYYEYTYRYYFLFVKFLEK